MHFISKKHMPLGLFLESIKAQGAGWEGPLHSLSLFFSINMQWFIFLTLCFKSSIENVNQVTGQTIPSNYSK